MAKISRKRAVKKKSKSKVKAAARKTTRPPKSKKSSPKVHAKPKIRKKTVSKKSTKANKPIGTVTHFFGNISVAIVRFSKDVSLGTAVRFKGLTTDFSQKISEMQYDHRPIVKSKKGKEVGMKVKDRVREGDKVFEEIR